MRFFKCNICGNLVELINDGGGELVCCGEPMEELVAKTEEEGKEKHLPIVSEEKGRILIKVGEVPHPMTEVHYIQWITIEYNNKVQRVKLNYSDKPEAYFDVNEDFHEIQVYEYCNIHGLWRVTYKK